MGTQTTAQGILAILESDVLTVLGPQLLTFLTAINPPAGTAPSATKVLGAWVQLHGSLLAALPTLEGLAANQIIASLQLKLAAALPPGTTAG